MCPKPEIVKISIHAPREGGDLKPSTQPRQQIKISIHAPREGGDNIQKKERLITDISIHAPREGGDLVPFAV